MIFKSIVNWYQSKFATNEPAVFIALITLFYLVLTFLGSYIAPILAALVIAYLLDTLINVLHKFTKINRKILIYIVFLIFLILLFTAVFFFIPLIISQAISLVKSTSAILPNLHSSLEHLAGKYHFLTEKRIEWTVTTINSVNWSEIRLSIGSYLLKYSASTLPLLFSLCVYIFLVPLMVFYFLTDKDKIIEWFESFLPEENGALHYVWNDLSPKLVDYVKGKSIEFILVSIFTYLGFLYFDIKYAVLLAFGTGLSVVIPYIGMALITVPVVIVGIIQFGLTSSFVWMLVIFFLIQALDGNILVPVLFSEVLDIHPVGVVSSILIFGGIWGIWGIFFAIPLGLFVISGINMFRNQALKKLKQ